MNLSRVIARLDRAIQYPRPAPTGSPGQSPPIKPGEAMTPSWVSAWSRTPSRRHAQGIRRHNQPGRAKRL